MRHRKAGFKLNRTASHRKAMMRNMVTSLFEHESIVTTRAKAKAVRPLADKMITLAKRGDLHARRQALSVLTKKSVTHKLFGEIKDRYMDRSGGYTSIVRIQSRRGDAAEMAVLRLFKPEEEAKGRKKGRKKGAAKKKAAPEAKAAPKKEAAAHPPEPVSETRAEEETEPVAEVEPEAETESAPSPREEAETEKEPE